MKEYAGRNTLLKAFQLIRQALKNAAPSAGDGVEITQTETGPEISVSLPTKTVTKTEYNALTDAEKQAEVLYAVTDDSPGGGSGDGGNPIGTIISFMGLTAPEGYLACDGAEHSVSSYPALAAFFEAQFGAKNHFGGDGTTTFAVPDMRNLFLRGYHGEAEEQLSGEVGEKQEGTQIPFVFASRTSALGVIAEATEIVKPFCHDAQAGKQSGGYHNRGGDQYDISLLSQNGIYETHTHYTSRPVNMAVLYCIKAI